MVKLFVVFITSLSLGFQSFAAHSVKIKNHINSMTTSKVQVEAYNQFLEMRFKNMDGVVSYLLSREKDSDKKQEALRRLKKIVQGHSIPKVNFIKKGLVEISEKGEKNSVFQVKNDQLVYSGKSLNVNKNSHLLEQMDEVLAQVHKIETKSKSASFLGYLFPKAFAFMNKSEVPCVYCEGQDKQATLGSKQSVDGLEEFQEKTRKVVRKAFIGLIVIALAVPVISAAVTSATGIAILTAVAALMILAAKKAVGDEARGVQGVSCNGDSQISVSSNKGEKVVVNFKGRGVSQIVSDGKSCRPNNPRVISRGGKPFLCSNPDSPLLQASAIEAKEMRKGFQQVRELCKSKEGRDLLADISLESVTPTPIVNEDAEVNI